MAQGGAMLETLQASIRFANGTGDEAGVQYNGYSGNKFELYWVLAVTQRAAIKGMLP